MTTIEMIHSKLHRATVTDANLNYIGSISIDVDLLKSANMYVGQKVDIVNINNGERFSTYIIPAQKGQRDICLNGAAARKVQKGDIIIIISYVNISIKEASSYLPKVVILDEGNNIVEEFKGLE